MWVCTQQLKLHSSCGNTRQATVCQIMYDGSMAVAWMCR